MSSFFYCHASTLDLHSFPTRRSSDLHGVCLLGQAHGYRPAVRHRIDRIRTEINNHLLDLMAVQRNARKVFLDRKSTRLNSSHRCISYAVFCLKKKKKVNLQQEYEQSV